MNFNFGHLLYDNNEQVEAADCRGSPIYFVARQSLAAGGVVGHRLFLNILSLSLWLGWTHYKSETLVIVTNNKRGTGQE